MATISVQNPNDKVVARWVMEKFLWVKWEVELQEGLQHLESKDFIHPDPDQESEWRLELTLNSNPSLSLHFKLPDRTDYDSESSDEDVLTVKDMKYFQFYDIILTTVCDGIIVDILPDQSRRLFKIPVSKHIKTDPGTILTFKFEIREMSLPFDREGDFLEKILGSSEFYDMEIRSADGQILKCHKLILSIVSPVIKAHLVHDGIDRNVFNTNFDFETLKSWLDHIYRRNWIGFQTDLDTVMNVFMVSDYFGTNHVSKRCCDLIIHRLTPSTLSRVVQHDMIYLSGDQAAKDVQDALFNIIEEVGVAEIEGMDSRVASLMSKMLERTKKRKAGEEAPGVCSCVKSRRL